MKPEVEQTIDGWKFKWKDQMVEIDVSRIHNRNTGISGEVKIHSDLPGYVGHLYQERLSFANGKDKTHLVRTLTDEYKEQDWHTIIEQLCVEALRVVRQGQPLTELCSAGDIEKPSFMVEPLIIKGYPNVIFGDPGSLKSTLALITAITALLPWPDNPMGFSVNGSTCPTLFLDYETDEPTIQWQLKMIQVGMGLPDLFLQYRRCSSPLHQDVEEIRRHISITKAKLIIIDSLGLACGGDLKEAGPALEFFTALRKLNITSLILAHTSKDKETKTKSVFGTVYFTAEPRNIWEIRKTQEQESSEVHIALYHHKPPPFQRLRRPMGFKLIYAGEESLEIEQEDPRTITEFLDRMSIPDRVLELLKSGPMTNSDMALELETPLNNITQALKRLYGRKMVVKTEKGWGLTSPQQSF